MNKKIEVIATLNSHLLKQDILNSFIENGATIFRINGSQVLVNDFLFYIKSIRSLVQNRAQILIDLPGNKIRTAVLAQPIPLALGQAFELQAHQLNFPAFIQHLKTDDILFANDSLFEFKVIEVKKDSVVLLSKSEGLLTSNKGIHLPGRTLDLPFLFERDKELINIAKENNVEWMGLSFVRKASDVREAVNLAQGSSLKPIVKVETLPAVEDLDNILKEATHFLVDRGDLSCDVGINSIERYQKLILRKAKEQNKFIFFATQFLHTMTHNRIPLIAEVCGLSNALQSGVDGIQLSEETAIGKHPVDVLKTVQNILKESVRPFSKNLIKFKSAPVLWLTGPSGAGKTTLSHKLKNMLEFWGYKVALIDGDDFRSFWNNETGYTQEDRIKNQKSIIYSTAQAAKAFDFVIVSTLSPYAAVRKIARDKLENFHEVYIKCSTEICEQRDPKGLYKKAKTGDVKNFVGVSDEYEKPLSPELTIDTSNKNLSDSFQELTSYIFE